MAQVWIEEIISHSPHELRLLSTDPTFWPNIENLVYKESWISVKPGAKLRASRFIIPWANSKGRLQIEYRGRTCYCIVGPISASSNDFLMTGESRGRETQCARLSIAPGRASSSPPQARPHRGRRGRVDAGRKRGGPSRPHRGSGPE